MIAEALRGVLQAAPGITDKLGTWEFSSGVPKPAIFTSRIIPEGCDYPAVLITEVGGMPWGTRGSKGSDTSFQIVVWDNKDEDESLVRDLAWAIWTLFTRRDLTPQLEPYGYVGIRCLLDAPVFHTDEHGFPGYLLTGRVIVLEASAPEGGEGS